MSELPKPTPEAIKAARLATGHNQTQAANFVHYSRQATWSDWEAGRRLMPMCAWELYLIKSKTD